jgi:hypothetical protein
MSLARGVLLTEIARLEKCIEEKRGIQARFEIDRTNANDGIRHQSDQIIEMDKRIGELKQEVDKMINPSPGYVIWGRPEPVRVLLPDIRRFTDRFRGVTISDPVIKNALGEMLATITSAIRPNPPSSKEGEKPEVGPRQYAHVSDIGSFPQEDLKTNAAPDLGLKWTGWKQGQGFPSRLAGQIVGESGELVRITAHPASGVSSAAAQAMIDHVFGKTLPKENFRPATASEALCRDLEKELASFQKCMDEARNFQAHIDAHRVQQKEWEGMATDARRRVEKIQAAINALEGGEV